MSEAKDFPDLVMFENLVVIGKRIVEAVSKTPGLDVEALMVAKFLDLATLYRIGSGDVSAIAFARFHGYPYLFNRIASLPMSEQEELANGKQIDVMINGQVKSVDPLRLNYKQIDQVFTYGK